jgi:predicted DCC family thiol-disulfide oxidoreductase YuxK
MPVILFDGVCNLCESSVRFVIARDRDALFKFASLQSDLARQLLRDIHYPHDELDSVLLIVDAVIYRKSRAILRIAKQLDGAWPALFYLFAWIPPFLADRLYDFVARRRYRWFGEKETCWLPDPDLERRFLNRPDPRH